MSGKQGAESGHEDWRTPYIRTPSEVDKWDEHSGAPSAATTPVERPCPATPAVVNPGTPASGDVA